MISRSLLAAMRRVESLPPTSSGALVIGNRDQPDGMILVERNRVVWSASTGGGRRLREILRAHCTLPLSDAELETLYARCRAEQKPLGETLVAAGLVSVDQLRAAMKQHTVESLLGLDASLPGNAEWPLTWVERFERGYQPRYTFTAAEVLAAVGAQLLDEMTAELVADHLQGLGGTGSVAVAFASEEVGGAPLFVGMQAALWLSVEELVSLAEWAAAALEASPGFSPVVAHACARSADGGAVAWLYERQRCAAICPTGQSLQRLVCTLDNRSLGMVLTTKLSVLECVRERTAINVG